MDTVNPVESRRADGGLLRWAVLPRRTTLHLFGATFAVVLWGASFSVTRAAVQEIPPLTLAFLRFTLATLVLWPVVRRRWGRLSVAPEDRRTAFALGFVGVTLYFLFENVGLRYTTASHGALIVATVPLASVLAEAAARRRLPPTPVLGGLLAALAGVGLIVDWRGGGEASLLGDSLLFGAVFSWVGYTFLVRRLSRRYPNLWITHAAMAVGAVTLFPLAVVEMALHPWTPPSPAAWGAVAYLGVFCSALAYLLWNRAIPVLGVSVTNNLIYGIPLVGVLTGVLALGEPFTPALFAGGALILGGVAVAHRHSEAGG